jgi:hypothetical protein
MRCAASQAREQERGEREYSPPQWATYPHLASSRNLCRRPMRSGDRPIRAFWEDSAALVNGVRRMPGLRGGANGDLQPRPVVRVND